MGIDGIGAISPTNSAYAPRAPSSPGAQAATPSQLSPQEQQQVQKLRQTDLKVRAHEQAHLAAAAGLAIGGAHFETVRGPDGRQYAVAGEVGIDVSPAQSPEQTIDKARRIQAAALAPADPSAQDKAVAAAAAQMQLQAQAELTRQKQAEQQDNAAGTSPLAAYTALEPAPEPSFSLFA